MMQRMMSVIMHEIRQLYYLNGINAEIMEDRGSKTDGLVALTVYGPTMAWLSDQWDYMTDDERGWSWESWDFNVV